MKRYLILSLLALPLLGARACVDAPIKVDAPVKVEAEVSPEVEVDGVTGVDVEVSRVGQINADLHAIEWNSELRFDRLERVAFGGGNSEVVSWILAVGLIVVLLRSETNRHACKRMVTNGH